MFWTPIATICIGLSSLASFLVLLSICPFQSLGMRRTGSPHVTRSCSSSTCCNRQGGCHNSSLRYIPRDPSVTPRHQMATKSHLTPKSHMSPKSHLTPKSHMVHRELFVTPKSQMVNEDLSMTPNSHRKGRESQEVATWSSPPHTHKFPNLAGATDTSLPASTLPSTLPVSNSTGPMKHVSCVHWLFTILIFYTCAWCTARFTYFVWMWYNLAHNHYRPRAGSILTMADLDKLGTAGFLQVDGAQNSWILPVCILGDSFLFGVALSMLALTYEMSRLVRKGMDRGIRQERHQLKCYVAGIHIVLIPFVITELSVAIYYHRYTQGLQMSLSIIYIVECLVVVYMLCMLAFLSWNGRKYENVHGQFIASPLYSRLKRLMIIYMACMTIFQVTVLIFRIMPHAREILFHYMGISLILGSLTGFLLAITVGCSQLCVLRLCWYFLSPGLRAEYLARTTSTPLRRQPAPVDSDAPTPMTTTAITQSTIYQEIGRALACASDFRDFSTLPPQNPVFVYTDIESSSALWAVEDGRIMHQATELHDGLLRTLASCHRGYEVATVGDSFQIAFHTIQDAVEYCLSAQLGLLSTEWPRELHDLIPATKRERACSKPFVRGTRIFSGLRVRMAIHDANTFEGVLIRDVHAITGKIMYTGMSELIAREMSELGAGGQILVSHRIQEWLSENRACLSHRIVMEPVQVYSNPSGSGELVLQLYQVVPAVLKARIQYYQSLSCAPVIQAPSQRQLDRTSQEEQAGSVIHPLKKAYLDAAQKRGSKESISRKSLSVEDYASFQTPRASEGDVKRTTIRSAETVR
uniref:Uncharacterized protein AlNc14C413G11471 n=1 Tax=Albugo laibachii Nc14 TaxID=890382 RepID=F0WZ65_9STRA|nr:conserved hypothetical protein [Albugo laibachii Nc14]|eukprot:CCA26781.1 conserved hypothetical protein [Albugo laibachii Nc14]